MEIISRKMYFWALPSMYLFERYSWFVERYNPGPHVSTLLTQLKQLYTGIAAPHDHQLGLWRLLWCEGNCQVGCFLTPEEQKEGSLSLQPLMLCCWLPNPPSGPCELSQDWAATRCPSALLPELDQVQTAHFHLRVAWVRFVGAFLSTAAIYWT